MRLKFISLNIWLGGILMKEAIEFLREQDADIVALQEVYNSTDASKEARFRTWEILRQELGYQYDAFHAAYFDTYENLNADIGNAVLSKFPITNSRGVFFDVPYGEAQSHISADPEGSPRNMAHAQIDWHDKELNVYSWHGIWGRDGHDNPRRIAMADMIVAEVKGKTGVIVAGDSNMNPDTEAAAHIGGALTDVFGTSRVTSFNMRRKENPAFGTAVVDLLYISPDLTCMQAETLDVDVSDHLPIVATIEA